jgi:hypothetical protein
MPSKSVESQLTVIVRAYNVSITHGINPEAVKKNPDPDEPAYKFGTDLELITEVLEPKEQRGYQLKLDVFGDEPHRDLFQSKVEDWLLRASRNKGATYTEPTSIGHIGRSRKKTMEGLVNMPSHITNNLLSTLKLGRELFLIINTEKSNGNRSISNLTIQHIPPIHQ